MSFGAVAAVRLEGTLRHGVRLLLNLVECCKTTVLQYTGDSRRLQKFGCRGHVETRFRGDGRHSLARRNAFFTRNGATYFLSLDHLKHARFSVLLSNPLPKVDFLKRRSHFGWHGRFSSQWSIRAGAETSSKQLSSPLARFGGAGVLLPLQSFPLFCFSGRFVRF